MAKADNNKESGAEKASVLIEDKGSQVIGSGEQETVDEIALEEVVELKAKVEAYMKLDMIQSEKIDNLLEENAKLEKTIEEKDSIIKEQKNKIAQLNKSIVDYGLLYSKEKEVELPKEGETVIRFLLSPAGRFKLPYNVGQEVALHKEVAAEIVESAYAEYVVEVE